MEALEGLTTIVILSIMVEVVTEVIKSIVPGIRGEWSRLAAALVGVLICVLSKIGILQVIGVTMGFPPVDYAITGLLVSRGSNAVHDTMTRIAGLGQSKKE